ncbi:hypothetical protein RHMOL_Rhmol01G0007300 [Rhododendron molle]|uniref:Uncharacterized protein n=1 Tax=Rhododendron molle TaxID=49168 RepID=A0ACC0PXA1_RHOML|nr:hypothetical protein RHMOL_Rhmol01G0007300 [Rhododendron molle]
MSSGDWICSSCQHMNFKKRDSCQRCGCPKFRRGDDVPSLGLNRTDVLPGDDGTSSLGLNRTDVLPGDDMPSLGINRTDVLPGDWYCNVINCGAHNYASRPNCYKCGATKNDDCNVYGGGVVASASGGLPGWRTGDWICARNPNLVFNLPGLNVVHTIMLAGWNASNVEYQELNQQGNLH